MASFTGDDGVSAVLGLDEEFVKEADAFAAAAGVEEKKRRSAAEFGSARPVVLKTMSQGRRDFGDKRQDQIGAFTPAVEPALEGLQMTLAKGRGATRCGAEAVEAGIRVQQDGGRQFGAQFHSQIARKQRRVAGAEGRSALSVRNRTHDLDNGKAGVRQFQRLIEVGQDDQNPAIGRAPLEFGADQGRLPAGAADPDDRLKVPVGGVGKGLRGIGIVSFEMTGGVNQLGPPGVGNGGGCGRGVYAGLSGQHGDQPGFDGAVELRIGGEERPAFE